MTFLLMFLRWLGRGPLDRILSTVDKHVQAQTDREAIRGEVVKEYMRTRSDWMRAGGVVTLMLFAVPTAFWWAALCLYNVLWCRACAYPQSWSVAAFPAPYDEWGFLIVLASIGALGVVSYARR